MNGLKITRSEFEALPHKEQRVVMFDNLEYIRNVVSKRKLHIRIQYFWLLGLTIIGGWIFRSLIT